LISRPKTIPEGLSLPPLPNLPPYAVEHVNKIIKNEIISTTDGGTRRYLVHWKGKHESDVVGLRGCAASGTRSSGAV